MFSEMQHIFSMYQRLAMAVREKSEDTKEAGKLLVKYVKTKHDNICYKIPIWANC
jgi:hypothetical protein